jgi:hypothetical protein
MKSLKSLPSPSGGKRVIFLVPGVAALGLCLLQPFFALADDLSAEQHVQTVFSELRNLKFMQPGKSYTVGVAGAEESGLKEQFLRRRTAREISESGLSCGCGDYAVLFIDRIEPRGFDTLLVDGAEISMQSLQRHFSGHAVVAIRGKQAAEDAPWWLVDSTNLKILSRKWSPGEKSFQAFGKMFCIGYCGPVADYPVHNAESLRAFYARTLAKAPLDLLNSALFRLKFTVDPSLIGKDGNFLNPRMADFLKMQPDIFAPYGITPRREIPVLLTRGDDNESSKLRYSKEAGWVGRLGLQSGCSPTLLFYFEREIQSNEQ